jgi:hydroxymethylbilane synthase
VSSSTSDRRAPLRIASRGSPLALWQAESVAAQLRRLEEIGGRAVEIVVVETTGDQRRDARLAAIGGRGVFTTEVRTEVMQGRADIAVHSAKDLPASRELLGEGLEIAAVTVRGDERDALVGSTLAGLPPGAVVATGSDRRRAQLAWLRPDLGFAELRGNVGTRLGKIPPGGAIVVAAAALERLGRAGEITEILAVSVMLPQVGQGALAAECRTDDAPTADLLAAIDHPASHRRLLAERAFLARLGGGCELPVGALAVETEGGALLLEGMIARSDGHTVLRRRMEGPAPRALGEALADELLDRCGGRALIEDCV